MDINQLQTRYGSFLTALDRFNDPVSAVRLAWTRYENDPIHIRNMRFQMLERLFGSSFATKLLSDPGVEITFFPTKKPFKVQIRTRSATSNQYKIATVAQAAGGCIYIMDDAGGELVLPGPESGYCFYSNDQKLVLAAPVEVGLTDTVNTVEDVQLLSFPQVVYFRVCDEVRCLAYRLHAGDTVSELVNHDMYAISLVNSIRFGDEPLRIASDRLRLSFDENMENLKKLWTTDILNPAFVDLYSEIVQKVVRESNGALRPLTGPRLFATWLEAVHYRPSEYTVVLDIQNVRTDYAWYM